MLNTYTIPMTAREDIEKAVARAAKKAAKYGKELTVTYGEPRAEKVAVREIDYTTSTIRTIDTITVEVLDLTIDSEIIKKDGYKVVAKIEHLDGGNVVNVFDGEMNANWSTVAPKCEHCNSNRDRKVTFIVESENGEQKQVGSGCLKEYCGIDPQTIGALNSLREIIVNEDVDHYDFRGRPYEVAYDTEEVLAYAIKVYREQGYVKSGYNGSNKAEIYSQIGKNVTLSADDKAQAHEMAEVIKAMDWETANKNLLDNTQSLLKAGYCKNNHFGYIAYAPVAYKKVLEKMERDAQHMANREAEANASEYVGEIGKRAVFEIAKLELVTSWEGAYGWTYLYKFTDKSGNVLIWFASGTFGHWVEKNGIEDWELYENVSKIKATVKNYTERDGVKQTVVTRVKVA